MLRHRNKLALAVPCYAGQWIPVELTRHLPVGSLILEEEEEGEALQGLLVVLSTPEVIASRGTVASRVPWVPGA